MSRKVPKLIRHNALPSTEFVQLLKRTATQAGLPGTGAIEDIGIIGTTPCISARQSLGREISKIANKILTHMALEKREGDEVSKSVFNQLAYLHKVAVEKAHNLMRPAEMTYEFESKTRNVAPRIEVVPPAPPAEREDSMDVEDFGDLMDEAPDS